MATTHVAACMHEGILCQVKNSEIRPIVTTAYIVPTLRTDLISVKSLNRQIYRVIHDSA